MFLRWKCETKRRKLLHGLSNLKARRKRSQENESNHDCRVRISLDSLYIYTSLGCLSPLRSTEFWDTLCVFGMPTWLFLSMAIFCFVSSHLSDCFRSAFFSILFIFGLSMFNVSLARITNSRKDWKKIYTSEMCPWVVHTRTWICEEASSKVKMTIISNRFENIEKISRRVSRFYCISLLLFDLYISYGITHSCNQLASSTFANCEGALLFDLFLVAFGRCDNHGKQAR